MPPSDEDIRRVADIITKRLADEGNLLAAGWQIYKLLMLKVPPHQPADDLQAAFESGCEYVFTNIISMLDEGDEPTEADLARIDRVYLEVLAIRQRLELRFGRTVGSA